MKEIYRSFDGQLGPENKSGYVVYDCGDKYELHFLSVYDDVNKSKIRIFKDDLPDVVDIERIGEINLKINDGTMRGDTFYKNKWYSMELINKIQDDKKDYNWRKYI